MIAKTQKSLKRYAELATGLRKNNFFLWTKIKISLLFALVLAIFYGAAYLRFQSSNILTEALLLIVLAGCGYVLVSLALQQIEDGLQSQKRFISSASHELRTPLSIIKANSEIALMDRESATKEELIKTLESNMEEVDRMSEILSLLMHTEEQFTDTERKTVFVDEVDLSTLIEGVLSRCVRFANDKRIRIDAKLKESVVVVGNTAKLKGIVYSVLHNAVTYTPEGGYISVSLNHTSNNNSVEFVVKDTGIGIPEEDIPHIFDPFYRTKYAEKKGHFGIGGGHFGLGLTMAKKAVRDHNGSITVKSPAQTGTEVVVSLPITRKNRKNIER